MATWSDVRVRAAQPPSVLARIRPELARANAERRAQRAAVQAQTYPSSSGTYGSQLYEWLVGDAQRSAAGTVVNERTILCVGAVYACVSLIAGAVASLPLPIYQRTPEGRSRVDVQGATLGADLWWLLNEQPHPTLSAAVFWEYLSASLLLHGDAFARILRRDPLDPRIVGMLPVHPDRVEVKDDEERERLVYTLYGETKTETVQQDDMLHIPGIGFDGKRGLSPLRSAAKSAVGIALAADEYQARFFGNGARPDFALTSPGKLDDSQVQILRDTWQQRFGGASKSHLPAILTGGLDVKPLNLSHEDMQIIATRQFQVVDIARIFGVPPHMIGETEKTSSWGSGIEAMGIGFVRYTLQRHLVKIEQEINRKLFPRTYRWFAEFDVNGLERGDYKSRNEGYRVALGRAGEPGWMTVNEVRRLENLPPIDGGETLNGAADQDEENRQSEALDLLRGQVSESVDRVGAEVRGLQAQIAAMPPPPAPHVEVTMPAQEIRVEAPRIESDVKAPRPRRELVEVLERDDRGRIKRAVKTQLVDDAHQVVDKHVEVVGRDDRGFITQTLETEIQP